MTEFLKQLWETISKLPNSQKVGLGVINALVVIGIISASMWGTQRDFIPLFEERLKIEDAGEVVAKLQELGVSYRLDADSTDIRVPLNDKSYILLQLAQENSLPGAKPGWQSLVDERSNFTGTTQQELERNFLRGLQTELERSLVRMSPIQEASVSIVRPKREIFREDRQEPSASILIEIRSGFEITQEQVRAIRDWVASAVDGLEPQNVRIADTSARDLSRLQDDDDLT